MRLIFLSLSLVLALPAAAQETDLAVVGGSVLDVRAGTMSSANVVVGDGRILSVGPDASPAGIETLDVGERPPGGEPAPLRGPVTATSQTRL